MDEKIYILLKYIEQEYNDCIEVRHQDGLTEFGLGQLKTLEVIREILEIN